MVESRQISLPPFRVRKLRAGALAFVIGLVLAAVPAWSVGTLDEALTVDGSSIDVYRYAGECVALRDSLTDRYVARDDTGYRTTPFASEATPFRMQATDLGSYLLYGIDSGMPAAGLASSVVATEVPGPKADWIVSDGGEALQLSNVSTGLNLSLNWRRRLTQKSEPSARWRFKPAKGCAAFPEVGVDVEGAAASSHDPEAEVRGLVDAHVHVTAFEFLGGRFHCGRPWSPYGVSVALKDCPDHGANGRFAIAENLVSTGSLTGMHSNQGWPDFGSPDLPGWPRYDSLTHEGTYWKGIERAWRAGLRVMVVDLVENRALCELYWLGDNPCTDMASVRLQAQRLHELQDYIDAQSKGPGKGFFRIVTSPAEARAVINEGKLAVVIGVETSQPFDCLYRDGVEICSEQQIDDGLAELWSLGVRSLFPVHKFDNAFGGTAMDAGTTGILVNLGNRYMTGRWWEVEECTGEESDRTPGSLGSGLPEAYLQLTESDSEPRIFDEALTAPLESEALPSYPEGPVCNVRGLTELGEYLINRMIDMGMIIETDHLSAKARDRALEILEERGYSGVITSHSWGGSPSRVRIQALGGIVAPYANTSTEYIAEWEEARATQPDEFLWGIAYGADTNGLGEQAAPRPGALGEAPVTYPFTSVDGSVTILQSRWGTRLWNFNLDGASHYGLFADWVEDLEHVAGRAIVDEMASAAEAYLQMWERATAFAGSE